MPPTTQRTRQRIQIFPLGRKFIGGSDHQLQRKPHFFFAVQIYFFIQHRKQSILNAGSGFPYLIQENDIGCGQIPFGHSHITVFVLQGRNRHRSEYLIRRTETGHQIFKRPCTHKSFFQPSSHHRLGYPGRAQQ